MAAAFASQLFARRVDGLAIRSAGLVRDGVPATAEAVETMARRGLDLSEHRSQILPETFDPRPELVIAMAREHARAVVERDPELFARTFTLKELVRRGDAAGPRQSGENLATYLVRLGAGREFRYLVGASSKDDIADPIGKPLVAYENCASELESLILKSADLLWPRGG